MLRNENKAVLEKQCYIFFVFKRTKALETRLLSREKEQAMQG